MLKRASKYTSPASSSCGVEPQAIFANSHLPERRSWVAWLASVFALLTVTALAACGGGDSGSAIVSVEVGFSAPTEARAEIVNGFEQVVADRQLLVFLKEDVTPSQYTAVIERIRSVTVTRIGEQPELRTLQVSVAQRSDEAEVADAVRDLPGVDRVAYNIAVVTTRANPPIEDPVAAAESPIDSRARVAAILPAGRYWTSVIGLDAARAVETELGITTSSAVAVIDTGVPAGQNVIAESRLLRQDQLGQPLTDDSTVRTVAHGLSVTGFAAGSSDDAGGVSDKARVISVDVYSNECDGIFSFFGCPLGLGVQFTTDLYTGVLSALSSEAKIINVSWGADLECYHAQARRIQAQRDFREYMKPLVIRARSRDRLLVFSAGNDCEKRDDQLLNDVNDVAADSWASHALIVGASNSQGRDAWFSRMGNVVDLVAPGESVSWGQVPENGTSFSAPIVAGAASLIQGIIPNLSAAETRALLLDTAVQTLAFTDTSELRRQFYSGDGATGPNRVLDVGSAARAARLARVAPLRTLESVELRRGERRDVSFEVEIPSTGVRALDVVLLVDVSGSYGDDISTLRSRATRMIDALAARGIDVQFGVATFADFPLLPFGDAGDRAWQLVTPVTADRSAVLAGINSLRASGGGDEAESQLEALYQVATGRGRDINGDGRHDLDLGDLPPVSVGWRSGAARVVLLATDAAFHDAEVEASYPGSGFGATVAALRDSGVRVIGLQSGSTSSATAAIQRVVSATGGTSYQLGTDSAQIAEAVAAGINSALAEIAVTSQAVAGQAWVTSIAQSQTQAVPGERLTFTVSLEGQRNSSISPLSYDVYLWVRGNGSALLQRVKVPITVPQ